MQEPLRSQYLAALGVENYVPRFVLPGAKISEPCEWFEASAEVANSSALIEESFVAEQAPIKPNSIEKVVRENIQRAPIIDTAVKTSPRISENSNAKTSSTQLEVGPQFALSIVLAGGGILLIDSAPASNAERNAFQQLLSNMLPALRPAASQYVLDIFLWPMTRQPKIARDENAAKEALAAYLHKQIQQRAIDTVLLLGTVAQQWCTVNNSDTRVVQSSSLLACVKEPTLKRSLWNDIRHLAERS